MRKNGNHSQWGKGDEPEALIEEDICQGNLYVLEEADIHAVFAFIIGEDPTYLEIEEGNWKSEEPYAVAVPFSLNSSIIHFQTLPAVMPTLTLCSFPQDNTSFYQRTYYGSSSYAIRGLPSGTCTMPQLTKPYFSNTCCITLLSLCVSIRRCGTCALQ